jgi:hypothetical protein
MPSCRCHTASRRTLCGSLCRSAQLSAPPNLRTAEPRSTAAPPDCQATQVCRHINDQALSRIRLKDRAKVERANALDLGDDAGSTVGRLCKRKAHQRGTNRRIAGCERVGGAQRRVREAPLPAYLSVVPDGRACGVQCSLVGHHDAQRCPRISRCWAELNRLDLRHSRTFSANWHERAVKTHRAFDARLLRLGQPSAVPSTVDMPSGASSRQRARPAGHLEASLSAIANCRCPTQDGTPKPGSFGCLLDPLDPSCSSKKREAPPQ